MIQLWSRYKSEDLESVVEEFMTVYSARRANMSAPMKSRAWARLAFCAALGLHVALAWEPLVVALGDAEVAVAVAVLAGEAETSGVSPSLTMRTQLPKPPLDWKASVQVPLAQGMPPGMRTTSVSTPSAALGAASPFCANSSAFWNEPGAPVSESAALKNVEPSLPLCAHASAQRKRREMGRAHALKCLAKTVTVPSAATWAVPAGPL